MNTWSHIYRYILSAVILLVGVSCTQKEEPFVQELALKLVQDNLTKAGNRTPLSHPTFGLFANYTTEKAGTNCSQAWEKSEDNYFDNKCFLKTKESNPVYLNADYTNPSALTHKPIYWPYEGSLMFTAYAPHSSQNSCIKKVQMVRNSPVTDQSRLEIDVVLREKPAQQDIPTIINENGKDPLDLLWVDTKDIHRNKSLGNQKKPIPLVFHHAMCKVTFMFYNKEGEFMLKARLLKCVNAATFFSGTSPGWKPKYGDPNLLGDYDLFTGQPVQLGTTPQEVSIITIPMQLNGKYTTGDIENGEVILELEITNKDGIGHEKKQYLLHQHTNTTAWERMHRYIYHININAHGIEFEEPQIELL